MSQIKRSLAIRPTYTRQISNESRIEMASPLSTIPPPSVMDEFERNPVRSNTAPVAVAGRVWNLPRPLANAAGAVQDTVAKAKPHWREGLLGILAVGVTAWLIALTAKLSQANKDIDLLYNMPWCDEAPPKA